ncbi:hypothetical protein ACF8Q8_14895 [Pseudomonas sp. FYR_8]
MLANEKAAKAIESILLGDQRYFACFSNFKERNKLLEGYREAVSSAGLNTEMNCTFQQVVGAVEPGRLLALYRISELSVTVIDESIQTLDLALTEIGGALDKKFQSMAPLVSNMKKLIRRCLIRLRSLTFRLMSLKRL